MSNNLQGLLEGIYSAVLEARRSLNEQHLNLLQSYFVPTIVEDPETGQKTEVYAPRMVALQTGSNLDGSAQITEAPVSTLLPINGLAIRTLEIEFETRLSDLATVEDVITDEIIDEEEDERGSIIRRTIRDLFSSKSEIQIMQKSNDFESSTAPAKVKITFEMSEAPEGMSLIQEGSCLVG